MNTKRGKTKLRGLLRGARFRVWMPFFSYEISIDDLLDDATTDTRIAKLDGAVRDLRAAAQAVTELREEAVIRQREAHRLREEVRSLEAEKATASTLLSLPEGALANLLARAGRRGRIRGWIAGAIIGLLTGVLSGLAVWYFTT